jgi:group II intron reverse transcriptase/maturase/CRISPR-associated endonuclease Cas1
MIRPLAILGQGLVAGDLALRRILRFSECRGPLVVLDWIGRGAPLLHPENEGKLSKRPVVWCDLANRQRPLALFRLERSERFRETLISLLREWRDLTRTSLGDKALAWVADVAFKLAEEGPVGLGALYGTLTRPEVRRWFVATTPQADEFGRLLKLLAWALRFSAVYALSESPARLLLPSKLGSPQTVWIEIPHEHFEAMEHRLVCSLVDALVWETLWRIRPTGGPTRQPETMPTVLQLFPQTAAPDLAGRLKSTAGWVRHIGVFQLSRDRPPSSAALNWIAAGADVWVAGELGPLAPAAHASWVTGQAELTHLGTLKLGDIWARSGATGQGLLVHVKRQAPVLPLPWRFRLFATARRRPSPARQMSTALESLGGARTSQTDLYQKLCDKTLLRTAWLRVSATRSESHGVDGVTIARFKVTLEQELDALAEELATRRYRCRPLRRVFIPKASGEPRPIGVACVRDRIAQTTCLMVLEPIFEPTFSHFSFGFRPRRNAHQALAMARSMIGTGRTWTVFADIEKCFDTIDHDVLLGLLGRRVSDPLILALIRHWLTADVLEFRDFVPVELGVPQGDPLSPLLSNIYLDPLDKHFETRGIDFVRYADDILLFAPGEAEALRALQVLGDYLHDPLHLALKPAKTDYAPVDAGVDYLGFRLTAKTIQVQQSKLDRALIHLRQLLTMLGATESTFLQRARALSRINALIRGFRNYFALPEEPVIMRQMQELDGQLKQMAYKLLPSSLRDDPAWSCRERLVLPDLDKMREAPDGSSSQLLAHDIYPDDQGSVRPVAWMVEPEQLPEPTPQKPTVVTEDPGETQESSEPESLGVLEHSGRLYVMTHGSYVTVADDVLIVKKRKVEICRRPLDEIGLVFLQGFAMNLSVALTLRCAERDIPVVVAPLVGHPLAVLSPIDSTRSHLRGRQVLRRNDPDVVTAGLRMLAAKVGNQASVLRYFAKYRRRVDPDLHKRLVAVSDEIRELAGHLRTLDPCGAGVRATAMGIEGHAAALYWGQLMKLVPPELGFKARHTQGASDPVNQGINYVYGILYGEVWRALVKVGLDPYFGLMHGSERDQGSLVFDLIEEFRAPFADRLALAMIGRGLKPKIGAHGFLRTRIRQLLAQGFLRTWNKKIRWRGKMITPASILEHQAGALAKLILGQGDYQPFHMRW